MCCCEQVYVHCLHYRSRYIGAQEGNYVNIILKGNTLYLSSLSLPRPPGLLSCTFLTVLVSQLHSTPLLAPHLLGFFKYNLLDAQIRVARSHVSQLKDSPLFSSVDVLITLLWVFLMIDIVTVSVLKPRIK